MTSPSEVHIGAGEDTTEHMMGACCPCKPAAEQTEDATGATITYWHRQVWRTAADTGQRWEPDGHLVAAVLSAPKASRRMTELSNADRAYLVAGLTLAGMTAKDIAERLDCSLRLVRSIRAEDMTQVCVVWMQETREIGDDLRTERCDHALTRRELAEAQTKEARLQMQLDKLVDAHLTGTLASFRCGHPKVPYNTYEHGGKRYCRQCRSDRKAEKRALTCAVVNC